VTYRLTFELDGLPRMANPSGKSTHWRAIFGENRKWKSAVFAAVQGRLPKQPLTRFTLTLVRVSSVEPDYDGCVRGFKAIVDGLREARVIADDKITNTGAWRCSWEKCKPGKGKVRVTVDERTMLDAGVSASHEVAR
jgi:hypothetical protein